MSDNTVYVDVSDLTEDEIDLMVAAAVPLGAQVEELPVTQNVEDFLPYAPIVIAVLRPFLQKIAETVAPQLETFVTRAVGGRHPRTIHLLDLDIHLLWDKTAEEHKAAAVTALRQLEPGTFEPGTTLVFDPESGHWQAP